MVELMVAMSVTFVIIAVTLAAYTFIARNFTRMANTQRLEADGRRSFAMLNKDILTATQISSATTTQLVLSFPSKTVTYSYASGTLKRVASAAVAPEDVTDTNSVRAKILTNLTACNFYYFDTSGNAITTLASIKEVELMFSSSLSNAADNLKTATYTAVSPRFSLSNRSYLQ